MVETEFSDPASSELSRAGQPVAGPSRAAILAAVSAAFLRQTGQRVTDSDLDAELRRDLGLDWGTVGLLLVEAAFELGLKDDVPPLSPQRFHALRTLGDLVVFFEHAAARGDAGSEASRSAAGLPIEPGFPMPIEFVSGSPREMGLGYGRGQAENVRRYIEENVAMLGLARLQAMPELQEAIASPDIYFGSDEIAEMRGIADGVGIPHDFLIGHNLGLYPDYVPGCSQFAVAARRNGRFGLVQGVNEDSPVSLRMREHLTRVMTVRAPKEGIAHLTFGVAGQLGGLNGANSAGLIVTTTLLLDRPRPPGTHGLIHPVIVKRILESASTIPEALDVVRGCTRNGAWSMCITHTPSDRICYVEYDTGSMEVSDHLETLLSTNHSLLHKPLIAPAAHSLNRFERLRSLLNLESNRGLSPSWARTILRDRYDLSRGRETPFPTMHTVRRVDNQGSFVFVPAAGELWATAGPMAPDRADSYFRISLDQLFAGQPADCADAVGR